MSKFEIPGKFLGNENYPGKINPKLPISICVIPGLDHPCIIKIIEVIEDSRHVVFVLEYAKGGELFDFVLQEYKSGLPFNEKVAKFQMYQLLSAMGNDSTNI